MVAAGMILVACLLAGLRPSQLVHPNGTHTPGENLDVTVIDGSWTQYVEESFEDMATGASFETGRSWWTAYNGAYGTATAAFLAGSLMGRVYASGTTAYYMTYQFSTVGTYTSGVKIDFDMATDATNRLRRVYLGSTTSLTDFWYLSFQADGTIAAQNGALADVILCTYTANTRYHVTVEFVGNMYTFDVSINGTKYTNGGLHFKTRYSSATGISVIRANPMTSGAGSIYMDNIDASWIAAVHADAPTISAPSDMNLIEGQTGAQISWVITDLNATIKTYEIFRNNESFLNGTWVSGGSVACSMNNVTAGSYNYTIIAHDGLGHSAQDTVMVVVVPNVAPVISTPADVTYAYGATNRYIYWTVTDATTVSRTYTVYRNGTSVGTGYWTSGLQFSVIITGLAMGSYNYTIIARDGAGLSVSDEVIVTVINGIPTITHPSDYSSTISSYSHSISWTVTDQSTTSPTYIVLVNGSLFRSGTWTSGWSISVSLYGLTVGSHNLTIFASDGYGGEVNDTVIVRLWNDTPWITHPLDQFLEWDGTNTSISWTVHDYGMAITTYTIYVNGTILTVGTWLPGVSITVPLDSLGPGRYNFTIVAHDGFGGMARDQVWITKREEMSQRGFLGLLSSSVAGAGPFLGMVGGCLIFSLVLGAKISSRKSVGRYIRKTSDGGGAGS